VTRAVLITNPAAARHAARAVLAIRDTLRAGGWDVEVRATAEAGDVRRFAADARAAQVDVVVCYGGDGTAMQAAAGLVGSDIPLGLVPEERGTSWRATCACRGGRSLPRGPSSPGQRWRSTSVWWSGAMGSTTSRCVRAPASTPR